jgi:hypothetical protein
MVGLMLMDLGMLSVLAAMVLLNYLYIAALGRLR